MEKFFNDKIANIHQKDNLAIIGNRFNGKWIKIPIECYSAIKYSVEKEISIYNTIDIFQDLEDKKYYTQILDDLNKIGLLEKKIIREVRRNCIPIMSIAITNRCNLNCDYCCKDSNKYEKDVPNINDLKMTINKLVKLNPVNISISGGEPLLRKDFKEFIDYTKKIYKNKLILCTNATLINSDNAKYIADNFYAVQISLDGYDEESCSAVRGKGVFNKTLKSLDLLKQNGCEKISLSMVVGKHNFHHISKFEELNSKLGTDAVIRNFSSFGRGVTCDRKYLEKDSLFFYPNDFYENLKVEKIEVAHCNAGVNQLHISSEGNIYPCPNLSDDKFIICNIKEFDSLAIEKLYKRDYNAFKEFDFLKEYKIDKCKNCDINIFCNSCPAHTNLLKDNKVAFDKYCKFQKENLHLKIW